MLRNAVSANFQRDFSNHIFLGVHIIVVISFESTNVWGRVPLIPYPLFLQIEILKVLGIPPLKKLEAIGIVKLELENEDLVTRIRTPKTRRKPKSQSKLVNWTSYEGYHLSA